MTEVEIVTMTWEVDCEYETAEGNGVRSEGWIADAVGLFARCTPETPHVTTITRISNTDVGAPLKEEPLQVPAPLETPARPEPSPQVQPEQVPVP